MFLDIQLDLARFPLYYRDMKKLVKTKIIAEMFDVTVQTVLNWARDGKIPVTYKTPGGQLRFDPEAFNEWSDKHSDELTETKEQ